MAGWKLRPMDRTNRFERVLRRYTFGRRDAQDRYVPSGCPAHGGGEHTATVVIDVVELDTPLEGAIGPDIDHADPRWPARCACGYAFTDADAWQVYAHRLYRLHDTGEDVTARRAPIGAAWYAPWQREYGFLSRYYLEQHAGTRAPIIVKLPPGGEGAEWYLDCPASNGDGWQVTGSLEAGDLTASPSIAHAGAYHGFLRGGVLTEDVDGRTFPGIPRTA